MSIRCGNRARHATRTYHETIEAVRACRRDETEPCNWLVEIPAHFVPEIEDWVDAAIRECGALSYPLPGGRGWTCEAGHEHVDAEVRDREGWEYAEDEEEARHLRRAGVCAVLT